MTKILVTRGEDIGRVKNVEFSHEHAHDMNYDDFTLPLTPERSKDVEYNNDRNIRHAIAKAAVADSADYFLNDITVTVTNHCDMDQSPHDHIIELQEVARQVVTEYVTIIRAADRAREKRHI